MSDLISRKAAVDAITLQTGLTGCSPDLLTARDLIRNLPTAIGACNNCGLENICCVQTMLGEYGFCSQWKPQEEGDE